MSPMTPTPRTTTLEINGHRLSPAERYAAHSALLAQVDDVHVGGVYEWSEQDEQAALSLMSALTGEKVNASPQGAPTTYGPSLSGRVLVIALMVPIYDLDHPDLEPAEWEEAERLLTLLSEEFGR